jgi:hypothetical protein
VTLLLGGPSNTKQVVRDGDEADVWLQGSAASQAKSFEVISPKLKVLGLGRNQGVDGQGRKELEEELDRPALIQTTVLLKTLQTASSTARVLLPFSIQTAVCK